jgi:hypothetical protein
MLVIVSGTNQGMLVWYIDEIPVGALGDLAAGGELLPTVGGAR